MAFETSLMLATRICTSFPLSVGDVDARRLSLEGDVPEHLAVALHDLARSALDHLGREREQRGPKVCRELIVDRLFYRLLRGRGRHGRRTTVGAAGGAGQDTIR